MRFGPAWAQIFRTAEERGLDPKIIAAAKAELRAAERDAFSADPRRSRKGRLRLLEIAQMALRSSSRVEDKAHGPAGKH